MTESAGSITNECQNEEQFIKLLQTNGVTEQSMVTFCCELFVIKMLQSTIDDELKASSTTNNCKDKLTDIQTTTNSLWSCVCRLHLEMDNYENGQKFDMSAIDDIDKIDQQKENIQFFTEARIETELPNSTDLAKAKKIIFEHSKDELRWEIFILLLKLNMEKCMYNKQNSNSKVVNEIDNLFLKLQKDDGMLFDNDLKKALSVIVNKNSASELKDTFFDKNSNGEIADKLATKFDSQMTNMGMLFIIVAFVKK